MTNTRSRTASALAVALLASLIGARPALASHTSFADGDVFVSVSSGKVQWHHPDGILNQTLDTGISGAYTTGMAFDAAGNLYVTTFNGNAVSKFDPTGVLQGTFGSGYSADPESMLFDAAGNAYVGQADGTRDILKFDAAGAPLASFDVATDDRGSDWIDLAADQCTMFYSSEGTLVKRFDVCANAQLPDFSGAGATLYALRLLPPGDGSGGLLAASTSSILRLDSAGAVVQTYDAPGEDSWFALNLDPDGTSFWSADFSTGNVYRFDIASGAQLLTFNSGTGAMTVFGLAIAGEPTAARSCKDGPSISVTVTRPTAGRLYVDDSDSGPSGTGETIVEGTPLTVEATTSDPDNTASVTILLDGFPVGSDTTAPYSVAIDTGAVAPGPHEITAVATQLDDPTCKTRQEVPIVVRCFEIQATINRPEPGRLYLNDTDLGPSGGDALVLGGSLTLRATSPDPLHTAGIAFQVDGGPPIPGSGSGPYEAVIDTDPLGPGLHSIGARLLETNPSCSSLNTVALRKPDPAVKAVALGLSVQGNVPAEPQVHARGASVGKAGGADYVRIVDQPVPGADGEVHAITDRAQASQPSPFHSEGDSLVTDVSLLGGLIRAEALHAHARADLDLSTPAATWNTEGSGVSGLEIAGTPVAVSQPNTVVTLPGGQGRVVLQEVLGTTEGPRAEVTVNALHAFLDTPSLKGEVILGSAFAGVNLSTDLFTGPETDLIHRIDDAGTDADAGGTAATASPLTPGAYSGSLTPGDDSDFYSFQTLQGERIEVAVKPAEREVLRLSPLPQAPPEPTVPGVVGFALDAVGSIAAVGPDTPNFNLYLYDPQGNLRVSSELPLSAPERAELNADMPYEPAGARGTWTVEVRRAGGSPDGFYSLDLSLLPEELLDQNDAQIPGDAPDDCLSARALPVTSTHDQEIDHYAFPGVIRDADQADFYRFPAGIGQLITVALKPDELADGADLDLYLYGPASAGGDADCSSPITGSELGKSGAKALPDAVVQLPAQVTGNYVLEVRRYNAVANYYVDLTVANPLPTIPDNDAGTGSDAGDSCLTPTATGPGAYEGRLADTPTDDLEDWYSFSVQAGQDITASMKPSESSDFDLELYSACGVVAGDGLTVNHLPLSAPETVHLANAAAGTYLLRVVRWSGGGNYLLGLVLTP